MNIHFLKLLIFYSRLWSLLVLVTHDLNEYIYKYFRRIDYLGAYKFVDYTNCSNIYKTRTIDRPAIFPHQSIVLLGILSKIKYLLLTTHVQYFKSKVLTLIILRFVHISLLVFDIWVFLEMDVALRRISQVKKRRFQVTTTCCYTTNWLQIVTQRQILCDMLWIQPWTEVTADLLSSFIQHLTPSLAERQSSRLLNHWLTSLSFCSSLVLAYFFGLSHVVQEHDTS